MRFSLPVLAFAAAFLVGCASKPQTPVGLAADALGPSHRVGVAMAKLPPTALHLPGADCLLCIVVATAANGSLGKHAEHLATEDLVAVRGELATLMKAKNITAVVITEPIDLDSLKDVAAREDAPAAARKDFSPLRQKLGVDKLVVVHVQQLGFERTYSAYIPTSDPKAILRGSAYLVNLSTNTYEWFDPLRITKSADGAWDEPSSFPGLTNAYHQAVEIGREQVFKPFRQ